MDDVITPVPTSVVLPDAAGPAPIPVCFPVTATDTTTLTAAQCLTLENYYGIPPLVNLLARRAAIRRHIGVAM